MKFLRLVLPLLALSALGFADDLTPEKYAIGFGVGVMGPDAPHVQGWGTFCTKISDGNFLCGAMDVLSSPFKTGSMNSTSFRAGYERVLFRQGGWALTTKLDAGGIAFGQNVGGSYGAGGSLLRAVNKHGLNAVGSATFLHNTVGPSDTVVRVGVLWAFGK